jgi:hypothetical protein
MVVKFRNTIWPPQPQLSLHGELRCQAIQMEHGSATLQTTHLSSTDLSTVLAVRRSGAPHMYWPHLK